MPNAEGDDTWDSISSETAFAEVRGGRDGRSPDYGQENADTVYTIVSLRAPQYGVPLYLRRTSLVDAVPGGSPSYVGLFASMPNRAGEGGTECAGSGYARVSHSTWRNVTVADFVARRANSGLITFAALTGDLVATGWGIWDAASGGNLRAFGLLRNSDGAAQTWEFGATDTPRFLDGELQWGIQ